ncbi:unnamed protein product [Adineta ricciae]|uniref:Carboxyltransferase domain-containing protein n=2 Tax=Adineta ricciae TaxID=249248 RepID=A0A815NEY5_ADIRI|nr:unnamed protein product [Adineta ricciae]
MEQLEKEKIQGIQEISPGVSSLQIHFDGKILHQQLLIEKLIEIEQNLFSNQTNLRIQSRILYLPLTFQDSTTLNAVQRYQQTVRHHAPYLPNNVDFIQRINGLQSTEDVRQIVFNSSYLILGLGDVYLGAPCAIPIDPRHRLVTSKYNPARTFTPEGTVGIGGVYLCIYGMDSPGGYQLIGRTLPIFNTFCQNQMFKDQKPWLFRFFDQIRFYPVDENQLEIQREDFRHGKLQIKIIEDNFFYLNQYDEFLQKEKQSIDLFLHKRDEAFNKEISLWKNYEQNQIETTISTEILQEIEEENENIKTIRADICGNVWKILIETNQFVNVDTPILILEAMKMELIIRSPFQGQIINIHCQIGQLVSNNDILFKIQST